MTRSSARKIVIIGTLSLVGGTFSSVNGQPALGLAGMDSVTGEPDASFAVFAQQPGRVLAVARQPDGKIIAGGEFDMVDDLPRANLARFTAEGALDPTWFPNPNGSVNALVAAETNLYVAGFFRELKNRPRPYLARLDYASDLAHNWPVSGGAPPLTSLVATPTRLFRPFSSLFPTTIRPCFHRSRPLPRTAP